MDSSLADFEASMTAKLRVMMSPAETSLDWESFFVNDESKPVWLKAREASIKRVPGFWRDLPPIQFGMQLFDMAGALGYRRVILTKGPRKNSPAWKEKVDWCDAHLPELDDLTICTDKGLTYGKVLYDDFPPYILRWLTWRPRGKVLMLDTFHNKGFEHSNVMRVYRDDFEGQRASILAFLGEV